jgi:hypothetical protein
MIIDIADRARLELEFNEWRKKQIPPAKNSVQSFLVFLMLEGLFDNDKLRSWVRDKELND